MAPAGERQWWSKFGLKPPEEWDVSGATDLIPLVRLGSKTQADRARLTLDGAIHGVTNVWLEGVLDVELRREVHKPGFWCLRSADAAIRSFGGPYVLGQEKGKLKLVRGAPHTDLTRRFCRANNVVYSAVHLMLPPSPGFNEIIFGLTIKRAGFHYHQDTIGELKAKNAPLVGRQLVVTTVFYEHPSLDNKKEVVLWKPILNWSASVPPNADNQRRQQERSTTDVYLAARGVETSHGMIHLQAAGLQGRALHGVFHTPKLTDDAGDEGEKAERRRGYRIAVTSRIARPDAKARVEPFVKSDQYAAILGPQGEWTLPKSSLTTAP